MQSVTLKLLGAIAALAVSSTSVYAAPAVTKAPVKMSDQKLDSVTAGTIRTTRITVYCSFGNNCSGNGGSYNGNSVGVINVGNGTLAGASVGSGNSIRFW